MADSPPNERVFRINEKVREVIRRRLPDLEDFFVSVAIEAYKAVIASEPEDPFSDLKSFDVPTSSRDMEMNEETGSYSEEVAVIPRTLNGKTYYTFLDDESGELTCVHERVIADDNVSEVGDLVGYIDMEDRFWEATKINGNIESYTHNDITVPALKNTLMRYPDLDSLDKE